MNIDSKLIKIVRSFNFVGSLQNLHQSLCTILIKVVLVKKFHFCFLHPFLLVLNKLLLANNEFLFCIGCLFKMTLGIHLISTKCPYSATFYKFV